MILDWLINLGGLALILFIAWWFWGWRGKS